MKLWWRAAAALRSPHWLGLPLLPKSLSVDFPFSRNACNTFVLWIHRLALPPAAVVVDVGANHGDFARAADACFPGVRVLVVEPLPVMQRHLEGIIRRQRKNWRLLPCALGAAAGTLPLFVDENHDDIGSLVGFSEEYLKANPRARSHAEVPCEVKTLDDAVRELGVSRIDLLKIDVEGFEFEVLKGAAGILKNTRAVIVEVSLVRQAGAENPLVQMLEQLAWQGFEIVEVIPSLFDPAAPWRPREFNVLARRG